MSPFDSRFEDLGLAEVSAPLTPVRAFAPAVDDVLRCLIALRELHSDPARWCNTGMGSGYTTCIIMGCGVAARSLHLGGAHEIMRIGLAADDLMQTLLPKGTHLVDFNEGMGTTHADLMAFYDRAIAARAAEVASGENAGITQASNASTHKPEMEGA